MKIIFAISTLLLGLSACHQTNSSKNSKMDSMPVSYAITFPDPYIYLDDLENTEVELRATNSGERSVDPRLSETMLYVNGASKISWNLAVQNGRRPATWYDLPPGDSVSQSWAGIASSWFEGKGKYQIELRLDEKVLYESQIVIK